MSDELTSRTGRHDPPSPTVRDLMAVLFRQRQPAIWTFLALVALASIYAFWAPTYQSHMKLLLRRGRVDPVVSPERNSPIEFTRPEISEEEVNSEVELLRDQDLLRQVVVQNALAVPGLGQKLHLANESGEVRIARGVRRLAERLKVEPIHKTNLIAVSYEASDPALSARVLNSVARVYLEKHKEVRRSSEEFPFFNHQAKLSQRGLDDSETRLMDFSKEQGVVSASLERDLALQRLGDIENSFQKVDVEIAETSRRVGALEDSLDAFPPRSTSLIRTSDNAELRGTLQAKLLELELKRTDLLMKFEPGYRLVQEVQDEIDQTKAAIAAERLAPVREETTDKDPHYEWAKAELEKARVELTSLRARREGIVSERFRARAEAHQLGKAAIQQQDLLRSMKTAEETYLLYTRKTEEARIADALDERGIVNVILAEPPVAPALPKRSPASVMLIGVFGAAITSILLAFTVDYLDPAFRTPEEVADILRAPVLASLPRRAA